MSNYATTWAWSLRVPTGNPAGVRQLTPGAKFVLIRLADAANEDFVCWPSQRLISEETGFSKRTVGTHIELLEALGLITRVYVNKSNGARLGTRYKLLPGSTSVIVQIPTLDPDRAADDEFEGAVETAQPENLSEEIALRDLPVDNFESLGEESALRSPLGSDPSEVFATLGEETSLAIGINHQLNPKSSSSDVAIDEVELAAAAASPEDEDDSGPLAVDVEPGLAKALREVHSRLDASLLLSRLAELGIDPLALNLELAASEAIFASPRPVGDPVAYLVGAIRREPYRWIKQPGGTGNEHWSPAALSCDAGVHLYGTPRSDPWQMVCLRCGEERDGWRDERDAAEAAARAAS